MSTSVAAKTAAKARAHALVSRDLVCLGRSTQATCQCSRTRNTWAITKRSNRKNREALISALPPRFSALRSALAPRPQPSVRVNERYQAASSGSAAPLSCCIFKSIQISGHYGVTHLGQADFCIGHRIAVGPHDLHREGPSNEFPWDLEDKLSYAFPISDHSRARGSTRWSRVVPTEGISPNSRRANHASEAQSRSLAP